MHQYCKDKRKTLSIRTNITTCIIINDVSNLKQTQTPNDVKFSPSVYVVWYSARYFLDNVNAYIHFCPFLKYLDAIVVSKRQQLKSVSQI